MKQTLMIYIGALALNLATNTDCFSQISFTELELGCLNISRLPGEDMIIRSQWKYEELYYYPSPHRDCKSYVPPKIDFGNETLISLKADAGGCAEPERKIEITGSGNSCVVKLTI